MTKVERSRKFMEKRDKVIHAYGEVQAAQRLADAAEVLSGQSSALQLRYFQTLAEISTENSTTVVFPIPLDLLKPLYEIQTKKGSSGGGE